MHHSVQPRPCCVSRQVKSFSKTFHQQELHGVSLDDNIERGTVDMKVVEEMPFLEVRTDGT